MSHINTIALHIFAKSSENRVIDWLLVVIAGFWFDLGSAGAGFPFAFRVRMRIH
jgi:hypothetical protein